MVKSKSSKIIFNSNAELLKPKEAARLLSISYPTIKQWIYQGKISSIRTPGGHHRIAFSEVERLTFSPRSVKTGPRKIIELDAISIRNKLSGIIVGIHLEGLFAQLKIRIGEQEVMAIIPRQAYQNLRLKKGEPVVTLFKAIDVMVIPG